MKKNTLNLSVFLSFLLFAGCGGSSDTQPTNLISKEIDKSNKVNQSPVATFGNFSINKDTRYDGQLKATDADGDTLKYVIVTQPSHGSVVLHDNGCFTYTPNSGYKGRDSFSYRASDDVSSCSVKTVTVNVNEKDIQKPISPTDLTVTVLSTTSLKLTWSDNSDNEKGFVIYEDGKPICTTKEDTTTFTVSCGLEAGKSYNFEVKAQNEAGTSASSTATGRTKDVTTKPIAPTELKATVVEKTSLRLSWKDNSDNESSFEIYQNGVKVKTVSPRCTCSIVTGLKEGTNYNFLVKSVNKLGSADSNSLDIKTKGEATDEPKVTVAQALLGPLSEASFKIKKLDTDEVILEGISTKGDGTDIVTAGLIQVTQQIKDNLKVGMYIIEVKGGKDVDADDDKVWDTNPIDNKGTLHALMSDSAVKNGNFKVNILAEMVYQSIKDKIEESTESEIKKLIDEKASKLLSKDGDINGDGVINYDDAIAWNPAYNKKELGFNYDVITPLINGIMTGESLKTHIQRVDFDSGYYFIVISLLDNNNKLLLENVDTDDDGKVDYIQTYDENEKKFNKTSYTYNDDGSLSLVLYYNKDNNVIKAISYYGSMNGILQSITEYKYNQEGKKVSSTIDFDNDGIIDMYFIYDDEEREKIKYFDEDDDGIIDQVVFYEDEKVVKAMYDYNKDGTFDWIDKYIYDKDGKVVSRTSDYDNNGIINAYNYYDNNERTSRIDYDTDEDGTIDMVWYYEYDDAGNIIKINKDNNADGIINEVMKY